jgi:siroheme synthase
MARDAVAGRHLLMAVATLPAISRALLDGGLAPSTPAATVADDLGCTLVPPAGDPARR